MRLSFLATTLVLTSPLFGACARDHILVATLDRSAAGDAGDGSGGSNAGVRNSGGTSSGARASGGTGADATGGTREVTSGAPVEGGRSSTGGTADSGTAGEDAMFVTGGTLTFGSGGNVFILPTGGADGTRIGGGTTGMPELVCTCLGSDPSVCGTDGNTYQGNCTDISNCLPVSIACFHACPCAEEESVAPGSQTFSSADCFDMSECRDGFTCMDYSNTMGSTVTTCEP